MSSISSSLQLIIKYLLSNNCISIYFYLIYKHQIDQCKSLLIKFKTLYKAIEHDY